jgi:HD-GYP domain-containing protein (c-di-GMP phosphodiesterase class II)
MRAMEDIRLSEVISALSYALDVTEGRPLGHSVRSCAIGMRVGEVIGLGAEARSALFYALLLKDAGCSSNAARISAMFGTDDRAFKAEHKLVDQDDAAQTARHLLRHTRPGGSPLARARQLVTLARELKGSAGTLIEIRCERGAEIARMIGLPDAAADAIRALDERWDGKGHPAGLRADAIPLLGRIVGLAQNAEVFLVVGGREAALNVARERRGTWFDPDLVDALWSTRRDAAFWSALEGGDVGAMIDASEPEDRVVRADAERLDRVAEAFALVVDAKSPYTGRHSEGVARIAVEIGTALGFEPGELRDLRRAGLLHDIGKLGVSNLILDKAGGLTDEEWAAVRRHPELTVRILERVAAFRELAEVAGAHHERMDGRGYHRGIAAGDLPLAARVLAVADVCEALTADRPYRDGLPVGRAVEIIRAEAGTALCAEAVGGLEIALARAPAFADRGTASAALQR